MQLPTKKPSSNLKLTEPMKQHFIELVKKTGNPVTAAAAVGVTPTTVNKHKSSDSEFADAIELAKAIYLSKVEEELYKRAVTGVEKDIYYQGAVVGKETVKSDKLLELLVQAIDKRYVKSSNVDVNVNVNTSDTFSKLASFLKVEDKVTEAIEDAEYTEVEEGEA